MNQGFVLWVSEPRVELLDYLVAKLFGEFSRPHLDEVFFHTVFMDAGWDLSLFRQFYEELKPSPARGALGWAYLSGEAKHPAVGVETQINWAPLTKHDD